MGLRGNTDFTRAWTSGAASSLGTTLATLAYPLLALGMTRSAGLAGTIGAIALAVGLLTRLPAGVLIDRMPLRPTLVIADATYAVATLVGAVLLGLGSMTFAILAVVAGVCGICSAVSQTAHSVVLRDVVAVDDLAPAFALTDGREHAVALIGQPISGFLYGVGLPLPLLADSMAHAIAAAVSSRITGLPDTSPTCRAELHGPGLQGSWWRDILTGLRFIRREPFLRCSLIAAAVVGFILAGASFALTATLHAKGSSPASLGVMFAIAAAGGIIGAIVAPRIQSRLTTHAQIAILGWTLAAAVLACIWIHDPLPAGIILAVVYLVAAPANASLTAAQMRRTPRQLQGRVFSAGMLLAGLLAPIAAPVAGTLLDHVGQPTTFAILAIIGAVLATTIQASHAIRALPASN